MKTMTAVAAILTCLLLTTNVLSQPSAKPGPRQPGNIHRQLQTRQKKLDLEERQSHLTFDREMRKLELEKHRRRLGPEPKHHKRPCHWRGKKRFLQAFAAFLLVLHILLASWVYQDIRRRNTGSGLWIVIVLLSGLPGTLIYSVVRLGDMTRINGKV